MKGLSAVFWVLIGLLALYIVLKLAGVIQSPTIVEVSPFALLAALIYIAARDVLNELKIEIERKFSTIQTSVNDIDKRLSNQEGKTEVLLHVRKRRQE